jgi:hypothetical protein
MSYRPGCQPQSSPVTDLNMSVFFMTDINLSKMKFTKKQVEGRLFAFEQKANPQIFISERDNIN